MKNTLNYVNPVNAPVDLDFCVNRTAFRCRDSDENVFNTTWERPDALKQNTRYHT